MTIEPPVTLRRDQAETYDVLTYELDRVERLDGHRLNEAITRIQNLGVDLYLHCVRLESALEAEDVRLRANGTTNELDDRWIKNVRRLELMRALLDRAEAVIA